MSHQLSVLPDRPEWAVEALRSVDVDPVPPDENTEGLIWLGFHDPEGLIAAVRHLPALRWVQLPSAGVDDFVDAGALDPRIVWTSAKGAYAEPVAEHALTLLLAGLRQIPGRARATDWGVPAGTSLYGRRVLIVGAGGVARELVRLLQPFRCEITIVRRQAAEVAGVHRTITTSALAGVLPTMDAVVLAAAMTPGTTSLIDASALAAMPPHSVLVNIARGGLVDLEAVAALPRGTGPASVLLDVTAPEPLPAGHRLWTDERVLITPHTADTWDMIRPLLARRVADNAARFRRGLALVGEIDLDHGY